MSFKKKEIEEYLRRPNKCPNCGSENILVTEEFEEESKSRVIHCCTCECTFNEIYKLINIEKL